MTTFTHIDVERARHKLDAGEAVFVDIRDGESRQTGHIAPSVHLTEETVAAFVQATDPVRPVIVYCYHGNSSQMAAQFLVERGSSRSTVWTAVTRSGSAVIRRQQGMGNERAIGTQMRILITGVTGRIGANLAAALVKDGHHVRGARVGQGQRP